MNIHPAADLFPMITGTAFADLVADIKANGQQQTIKVMGDQILDGRNRHAACTQLGIEPRLETVTTDDPIAYVVSANIHRRHLSTQQRAAIAAKLATMGHGGDRSKGSNEPLKKVSVEKAADLMNVSKSSVKRAKLATPPSMHFITRAQRDRITLPKDRARPLDQAWVDRLADSILRVGQLQSIVVNRNFKLIAGAHRVAAIFQIWDQDLDRENPIRIQCNCIHGAGREIELAENLCLEPLAASERARLTAAIAS